MIQSFKTETSTIGNDDGKPFSFAKKLIIIICIVLLILIVIYIYRVHINAFLISYRDLASSIKDLFTIAAIVIGGWFSYFTFFHERTFVEKGDIEFEITLIQGPGSKITHFITVAICNKGTWPIWAPTARFGVEEFKNGHKPVFRELFTRPMTLNKTYFNTVSEIDSEVVYNVVDTGEKEYFPISMEFDTDIWAVNYYVEITSEKKTRWKKTIAVANRIDKKQEDNGINNNLKSNNR